MTTTNKLTKHGIETVLANGRKVRAKGLKIRFVEILDGRVTWYLSLCDANDKTLAEFGPVNSLHGDVVTITELDQLLVFKIG